MREKKSSKDSDIPIMVFSSGDPYPLQLIPTTMAAAAAATPGLGPLQLQVTSILWFCLCVCPFAVGHIFPNLSNKISFSSLVFPPFFCFVIPIENNNAHCSPQLFSSCQLQVAIEMGLCEGPEPRERMPHCWLWGADIVHCGAKGTIETVFKGDRAQRDTEQRANTKRYYGLSE